MNYIQRVEYINIVKKMPICCVDICIKADNKILLIKRNTPPLKGQWFIPGGRVFKNESLEDAAVRKALEETGLECEITRSLSVGQTIFKNDGIKEGIDTHTINIGYELVPLDSEKPIELDENASEYKWIEIFEMSDYNLHQWCKSCLNRSWGL